jgi:ankyrin repeat protein
MLACITKIQVTIQQEYVNGILFALMPDDGFFKNTLGPGLAKISDSIYPSTRDLFQIRAPLIGLATPLLAYQSMAVLIYVLSNGLHHDSETSTLINALGNLLGKLPTDIVTKLFRIQLLSVRALCDRLVGGIIRDLSFHSHPEYLEYDPTAVACLINIILRFQPEWTRGLENELLFIAALIGNRALVAGLLQRGARPSYYLRCPGITYRLTAIINAAFFGTYDCLKLLVNNSDINSPEIEIKLLSSGVSCEPVYLVTSNFILHLVQIFETLKHWNSYSTEQLHLQMVDLDDTLQSRSYPDSRISGSMDILLSAGADVDMLFPLELCGLKRLKCVYEIRLEWLPTCLDMSFYHSQTLFEQMQVRSSREPELTLTRPSICKAAMQGKLAFNSYMSAHTIYSDSEKQQFLEIILLELFHEEDLPFRARLSMRNAAIAAALIECGVILNGVYASIDTSLDLFSVWTNSVKAIGMDDNMRIIINCLRRSNSFITPTFIENIVELHGTEILTTIVEDKILCSTDIALHGAPALVRAARYGNLEAVSWLLNLGVDINAEFQMKFQHLQHTFTVIGAFLVCNDWGEPSSSMCRRLIGFGAKLRQRASDENCYAILKKALFVGCAHMDSNVSCARMFQIFDDYQNELEQVTQAQWTSLIRSMLRWICNPGYASSPDRHLSNLEVFQMLFKRYFTQDGSPILASMIAARCENELVQTLLDAGADVNEYSGNITPLQAAIETRNFELAHQLLELGANVNYHNRSQFYESAQDHGSALYAVCSLEFSTTNERQQKSSLIRSLLDHGADVDGKTEKSVSWGDDLHGPPLQACTIIGDIDCAILLLQRQADPNRLGPLVLGNWISERNVPTAPPTAPPTALDVAAWCGRLDMSQLFLKVGALSSEPGLNGYEGALQNATENGHSAIVKLIREHICYNEQQFQLSPELRIRHDTMVNHTRTTVTNATQILRPLFNKWLQVQDEDRRQGYEDREVESEKGTSELIQDNEYGWDAREIIFQPFLPR